MKCKPGDLCVVIPGDCAISNKVLQALFGAFITVTENCGGDRSMWHYQGSELVSRYDGILFAVHAFDEDNLYPIRPSTPSKATKTWSPKKQTLLTT